MAYRVSSVPVCMDSGCVSIANFLLGFLAPNFKELDPCESWDELSCGGFKDGHVPDNDFLQVKFEKESKAWLDSDMIDLVEKPYVKKDESVEEKTILRQHKTLQKYYWACMDWYEIVTQGLSVPQEFLGYITGRWHYIRKMQKKIKAEEEMPKEWNEEEVSMYAEGTRKLAEADVWVFAKYEPVKHEGTNVLGISPVTNIGLLSLEHYENSALVEKYKGWMETHISKYIMGNDWKDGSWANNLFEDIFEMEKNILKALPKGEDLRVGHENPWESDVEELSTIIPSIPLKEIIQGHPDKARNHLSNIEKPAINRVLLYNPMYWAKLNDIIQGQSREVMWVFLAWQGWRQLYNLWDTYYITEFQELMKEFEGKKGESRQQMCIDRVRKHLPYFLDALYINHHFPEAEKKHGVDMLRRIEYEVFSDVDTSDWLDQVSRDEVLRRQRDLDVSFGYQDESPDILDPAALDGIYGQAKDIAHIGQYKETKAMRDGVNPGYHKKAKFSRWWYKKAANDPLQKGGAREALSFYQKLHFNPKAAKRRVHAEDYIYLARMQFFRNWDKLNNNASEDARKAWHIPANANSPQYSANDNHLTIPAGLMHYPIMDPDLPAYVRYALIGSAMGKGLSQVFGTIASGTNAAELINQGRWSKEAYDGFWHGSNCFNIKYNGYPLTASDGTTVAAETNNTDVLNELISDTYGAKAAFEAWKMLQISSEDRILPGLERFSPEQLFFLFRSTRYCASDGPGFLRESMATGQPSSQLRNFAPLHELDAWREAFKCDMPQKACEVYGKGPQRSKAPEDDKEDDDTEEAEADEDDAEDEEDEDLEDDEEDEEDEEDDKDSKVPLPGPQPEPAPKLRKGPADTLISDAPASNAPGEGNDQKAEPKGFNVNSAIEDKLHEIPGYWKSNWNPANPNYEGPRGH